MAKTESQTRKESICVMLMEAGRDVSDHSKVITEYDLIVNPESINDDTDPFARYRFRDYVLMGRGGNPFAVVGTKKTGDTSGIERVYPG